MKLYHPFIIGKKIYLRGVERKDFEGPYFQWANDAEVTTYMFTGLRPNTLELLLEDYDRMVKSTQDIVLIVADKKNNAVIGTAGVFSINWVSRAAELRILIGEKNYWGKGLGTEVMQLLSRYAFEKLNLNKVWLGVNASHVSGIKAYEKAGFKHEGTLRQEIYRNGRYYDARRMSILREEYQTK